jgi:HPt (histidine-containing phosphotransfer) domain-containing protein
MPSDSGSIDTTNLLAVCRSGDSFDDALMRELISHFVDQNRRRMDDAVTAVHAGNRDAVRQIAHAVRGSAALLGAGRLHDLAYAIEHGAPAELPELQAAVAAMDHEFAAVLSSLHTRYPDAMR